MKTVWLGYAALLGSLIIVFVAILDSPKDEAIESNTESAVGIHAWRPRKRTPGFTSKKMPLDKDGEIAPRKLSERWISEYPVTAERWALSLKAESERGMVLNQIAISLGESDPEMALELAQRHALAVGIVDAIVGRWGRSDLKAAMDYAMGLPSKDARENALIQIYSAHAEIDPSAMAVLVNRYFPPGPAQTQVTMTILYHWLRLDETGAVAWAADFPTGELRVRAERDIERYRFYHSSDRATQR